MNDRGSRQEAKTVVNFAIDFIAALRKHTFSSAPDVAIKAQIGVQTGASNRLYSKGMSDRGNNYVRD